MLGKGRAEGLGRVYSEGPAQPGILQVAIIEDANVNAIIIP